MVERRPLLAFLAHAVMLLGVLIVAFPLYLAFVASTHSAQDIVQAHGRLCVVRVVRNLGDPTMKFLL